jgi:3-oxoacyl-[acyl-carrier-protein] synthase II
MTDLSIHGYAAISAAGDQRDALAGLLRAPVAEPSGGAARQVTGDPLPDGGGLPVVDFDIRARLGRRGTSFYDRVTGLAVAACGDALADSRLPVEDANRGRIGVVLGTTVGSFKSTSDYTRETLVHEKPYLVNPIQFPTTVMNCAAGQAAIRYGLKGINATTAGGPLAFFHAVSYARNAIRRGYADVMLVGAAEEFSAHRAWMTAARPDADGTLAGEGAAVFVLAGPAPATSGPASPAPPAGPSARICAVATGYGPGGRSDQALESCVRRVLEQAGAPADEVELLVTSEVGAAAATWDLPGTESGPAHAVLGHRPRAILITRMLGDCGAATPALALAAVLQSGRSEPGRDGAFTLLTARGTDGAAGALLVRRWSGCRS